MINSIRQLLRTPFKLILFLLLCSMSTALLVFGLHLWISTAEKLEAVEESFTTIGMVTQKEDAIEITGQWDAASKNYTNFDQRVYNKLLPETILQFEGANYLSGPEKRPFYGAYMPDYHKMFEGYGLSGRYIILEFTPEEDCVPNQPVRVNIGKVLLGETFGSQQLWYCDHHKENPAPLYAEKTYIACLSLYDNTHAEAQMGTKIEFVPWSGSIYSSQFDKTGRKLESELNLSEPLSCEEVTQDFYQTGRGRYWIKFIETLHQIDESIPVLPTDSLELLPAFHGGKAAVIDGKEITAEEFESGEAVCMITTDFARANNLTVGDMISLPLYFAHYGEDASHVFGYGYGAIWFSLLNAQGEVYPVFWEEEYRIAGIYRYSGGQLGGFLGRTEMGRDMVIIPSKSVKASDENNILDVGPMLDTNTSFQIPNGSIAEFEAAFTEAVPESSLLEITYDDNGYEQVSGNLRRTKDIAVLLGAIGLLSALAIFMLLLYFFVVKQKKRTAIERSLGMSRGQCRISLISGIMLLTIVSTVLGSIIGSSLIRQMPKMGTANSAVYSTMYSSWAQQETDSEALNQLGIDRSGAAGLLYFTVPALLCFFMLGASVILVNRNLDIEPILLLSTRED